MSESVLTFGSSADQIGILTEAPAAASVPAVVLLDPGLIHRVAPHRLYVRVARRLAAMGHDCFRFDFSGIGDSSIRRDSVPSKLACVLETREAMDCLSVARGSKKFVLLGLCGGGYFSFRTALEDERVVGLVLLNVRGHLHGDDAVLEEALIQTAMRLHYPRILGSPRYWKKNLGKVLSGQFDVGSVLHHFGRRWRRPSEAPRAGSVGAIPRDLDCLLERGLSMLNIYSEGDWSLDYLSAALGESGVERLSRRPSSFELIPGTNHLFTPVWSQDRVLEIVAGWFAGRPWVGAGGAHAAASVARD